MAVIVGAKVVTPAVGAAVVEQVNLILEPTVHLWTEQRRVEHRRLLVAAVPAHSVRILLPVVAVEILVQVIIVVLVNVLVEWRALLTSSLLASGCHIPTANVQHLYALTLESSVLAKARRAMVGWLRIQGWLLLNGARTKQVEV